MTGLLGIVVNIAVEVAVDCAHCPGGIDSAGNACEQNVLDIEAEDGSAGSGIEETVSADAGSLELNLVGPVVTPCAADAAGDGFQQLSKVADTDELEQASVEIGDAFACAGVRSLSFLEGMALLPIQVVFTDPVAVDAAGDYAEKQPFDPEAEEFSGCTVDV